MTTPAERPLWGGVYTFDREATEIGMPGRDDAESSAQRRVRESARAAGHRPVGGVKILWSDTDPDDPHAEPEPGRVWIRARVAVIPNGEKVTLDPAAVQAALQGLQTRQPG